MMTTLASVLNSTNWLNLMLKICGMSLLGTTLKADGDPPLTDGTQEDLLKLTVRHSWMTCGMSQHGTTHRTDGRKRLTDGAREGTLLKLTARLSLKLMTCGTNQHGTMLRADGELLLTDGILEGTSLKSTVKHLWKWTICGMSQLGTMLKVGGGQHLIGGTRGVIDSRNQDGVKRRRNSVGPPKNTLLKRLVKYLTKCCVNSRSSELMMKECPTSARNGPSILRLAYVTPEKVMKWRTLLSQQITHVKLISTEPGGDKNKLCVNIFKLIYHLV